MKDYMAGMTSVLLAANEKVYALLCVGFVRWENSVYTVLPKCVGIERRLVV